MTTGRINQLAGLRRHPLGRRCRAVPSDHRPAQLAGAREEVRLPTNPFSCDWPSQPGPPCVRWGEDPTAPTRRRARGTPLASPFKTLSGGGIFPSLRAANLPALVTTETCCTRWTGCLGLGDCCASTHPPLAVTPHCCLYDRPSTSGTWTVPRYSAWPRHHQAKGDIDGVSPDLKPSARGTTSPFWLSYTSTQQPQTWASPCWRTTTRDGYPRLLSRPPGGHHRGGRRSAGEATTRPGSSHQPATCTLLAGHDRACRPQTTPRGGGCRSGPFSER